MESVRFQMRKALNFLADQRGNVESSLVLIPLLILSLVGFQLATAVHARNINTIEAQADEEIARLEAIITKLGGNRR